VTLIFTTTAQEARLHGVKMLVHGRAGSGKTPLCATAPEPLIISAEAGLLSLAAYEIPTIKITSYADIDEAYNFVAHSAEARRFWTVCLDSVTEIAEQCLATEKTKNKDPRRAYGEMQDKMIPLIKKFRDLPGRHVYFSCKQEWQKDEVTGISRYSPSMPGRQVGPQLPYLFDEVFSLEVGETAEGQQFRYLRTRLNLQYEARDRSGRLAEFEEPHLGKIIEKILAT